MRNLLILGFMAFFFSFPLTTNAHNQLFTDVTEVTHNEILRKITAENIMTGTTATTFEPSKKVTRAELATYVEQAFELNSVRPAATFLDVPKTHPQHDAIQALYQAGILDGNKGKFNPNGEVKRAHIAKIFTNILQLEPQHTSKFKDITSSDANNGYIGALVNQHIIAGFPDGTFRPYQSVSRMQMATFLYRSLYGKEVSYTNQKITSNLVYAPTKIAAANYNINWSGVEGEHFTQYIRFATNGQTIREDNKLYFTYSPSSIFGSVDGTDATVINLDLRNLVEFKPQKRLEYIYGEPYAYTLTPYFNETVFVNGAEFKNVTTIVLRDDIHTFNYYLKEGYGLVKITSDHHEFASFELSSYKKR